MQRVLKEQREVKVQEEKLELLGHLVRKENLDLLGLLDILADQVKKGRKDLRELMVLEVQKVREVAMAC